MDLDATLSVRGHDVLCEDPEGGLWGEWAKDD